MQQIVSRLAAAGSILTVTHVHPDGDGLGSMVALNIAAEQAGKRACMLVPDDYPPRYDFLLDGHTTETADRFEELADAADVVAIIDTCAKSQLDGLTDALAARRKKVVVIDHHATSDDVGCVQWTDTTAAAAGVMVGELLETLGWPIDRHVAEALATAVATDTGWLRFSNTDPRALRLMARWLEAGVEVDELYRRIYQTDRPERLALMARALDGMQLHAGGHLAVMSVTQEDFRATGARRDETENLINEALRIGSVTAAVMLVEQGDGVIRASLRSRGGVDVAKLAQQFGGGGHARAAGCRCNGDLPAFREKLIAAFIAAMPDG